MTRARASNPYRLFPLACVVLLACGGDDDLGGAETVDAADVRSDAAPLPDTPDGPRDGKVPFPPPVGLIGCSDALFVDDPDLAWVDVRVTPAAGMDGIRSAIAASDITRPTRITASAGTYQGQCLFVEDHLRGAAAPLFLRGDGGVVQIDCSDGNGQAFGFLHASYIAIEGFTFGPASGHYGDSGVHISGRPYAIDDRAFFGVWEPSHHFIVRGNVMRNLNRGPDGDQNPDHYESGCCDGAKANQTEFVWYIGNTISRTARHGIDNVGVHHAAVCHNTFVDLVGEGQGVEAKGGSWDILFEGNRFERVFHRALMMGGEGTNSNFMWPVDFPTEAYGVVARNNIVVNAGDGGIGFYGCWSCTAIHNTIWFTPGYDATTSRDFMRAYPSILEGGTYDEWGAATRVGEALTNKGNEVVDNFFGAAAGDNTCPLDAAASGDGTLAMTVRNNLFYNGGNALPECGEGLASIGGYPDAGRTLAGAPGFVAVGGFPAPTPDLTPTAASPLVGAALAHPLAPTVDAAGRARPSPAAIGALEP